MNIAVNECVKQPIKQMTTILLKYHSKDKST